MIERASRGFADRRSLVKVARHCGVLAGTAVAVALAMPHAAGQTGSAAPRIPQTPETSGLEFVTPEAQQAIEKGLRYLASRQNADGSFGSVESFRRNVAVTALCGMAFLSAGHTPGRGPYGDTVTKTVDFILSRCRPNGYINEPDSESHGPMYGHGFATLFLAEVYGTTPNREIRDKLKQAVQLIINTQNDEGGWRYRPEPVEADLSVTICQIMALRAARNCGLLVPKQTVDRCVEYVRRCQNSDGGYRYQVAPAVGESRFPLTAAGIVALYSAGVYEGEPIERGLNYLMRYLPSPVRRRAVNHYFYGHYYAVQATWHAGQDYWRQWYPGIRDELLSDRLRLPNGGWSDRTYGDEYATAMACLILQMPNNYLPIFQR